MAQRAEVLNLLFILLIRTEHIEGDVSVMFFFGGGGGSICVITECLIFGGGGSICVITDILFSEKKFLQKKKLNS